MEREIRTMAFGTCRVAGPLDILGKSGIAKAVKFPHHLHYPAQVLQTVKHYEGSALLPHSWLYLMSEDSIRKSATLEGYVESHSLEVQNYEGFISKNDRFIIEISGLHEILYKNKMFVEYFVERDLRGYAEQLEALSGKGLIELSSIEDISKRNVSDEYMIALMREISNTLENKPILWVSHFDALAPLKVRESRRRCINLIRIGARQTGGKFFDPTNVIMKLGQASALKNQGEDLAHFTDEANELLSEVYGAWAKAEDHAWIE